MDHDDTGINITESLETLRIQQRQLIAGKRHAQMFPSGFRELPIPPAMERHQNGRGVFHFRPSEIDSATIDRLSAEGRENEMLLLGPFNKTDIAERMAAGEELLTLVELTADGTEVRAAAAVASTLPRQLPYFEETKEDPNNKVAVLDMASVLRKRLNSGLSDAS